VGADVLTTLLDRTDGASLPLTDDLLRRYGGPLSFPPSTERPYVFANFVSSIDGVVSFGIPGRAQASLISGGHPGDRFVLALLRAAADAIVVGAGTLRNEPGVTWSPEAAFPEGGAGFADLRARMGKPERAVTVLVSGSGAIDPRAPALVERVPVVVLTTERGATVLGGLPPHVEVRTLTRGTADEMIAIAAETSRGTLILTEGGPTLFGQFLRERAVDELFLTVAPLIAGRARDDPRLSLVEHAAFGPEDAPRPRLLSTKAASDYLFLRFALARSSRLANP
jgi:riboflavin biosynthesis pyrimidine reductase